MARSLQMRTRPQGRSYGIVMPLAYGRASKRVKRDRGCRRQYRYGQQLLPVPVRRRRYVGTGRRPAGRRYRWRHGEEYISADTDSTGNRGADGSQFTSSANVDGYNLGVYAARLPMPKRIAARMSIAGTNMVSTTKAA